MGSTVGLGAVGPDVKPLSSPPVIPVVELNRFAYEPLDVGSLSQPRVLDGASCSMANNSPDDGESMQGLAEMIQPAIGK